MVRPRAGGRRLFLGQLAVRRRGRVQDEAPRVADIGEMAQQLTTVDQRDTGVIATFEAKSENTAGAFRHVAFSKRVIFAGFKARVRDPIDCRMAFEIGRDFEGILAVPLHP